MIKMKRAYLWSMLMVTLGILSLDTSGQTFNNLYSEDRGYSIDEPKGNGILAYDCFVTTANTLVDQNGLGNFQLTFTDVNGLNPISYEFGDPGADERCNGVCESNFVADEFVLCGRSGNNHMLAMRVDRNGTILRSKEITFGSSTSEALYIRRCRRGYMIVGNVGNEIGAALLDEDLDAVWANTYPFSGSYLQNEVTDAEIFSSNRLCGIVGTQYPNAGSNAGPKKVFALMIHTKNGLATISSPVLYTNPNFHVGEPQIIDYASTPNTSNYNLLLSFRKASNAWLFTHFNHLCVLRTNLTSLSSINWSYSYHNTQSSLHGNLELTQLSNGQFAMLTSEHPTLPEYNPAIVYLDGLGTFQSANSFNEPSDQEMGGMVEGCNGNLWVNTEVVGQSQLRLISTDQVTTPCMKTNSYVQQPLVIHAVPQNAVSPNPIGSSQNYSATAGVVTHRVFDCNGGFLMRKKEPLTTEEKDVIGNSEWFFPNPTNGGLTINVRQHGTVRIMDQVGKEIMVKEVSMGTNQFQLETLPSGVYTIEWESNEGDYDRKPLIVQ